MSILLACHYLVPGRLCSVAVLCSAQPHQGLSPHAGVWGGWAEAKARLKNIPLRHYLHIQPGF